MGTEFSGSSKECGPKELAPLPWGASRGLREGGGTSKPRLRTSRPGPLAAACLAPGFPCLQLPQPFLSQHEALSIMSRAGTSTCAPKCLVCGQGSEQRCRDQSGRPGGFRPRSSSGGFWKAKATRGSCREEQVGLRKALEVPPEEGNQAPGRIQVIQPPSGGGKGSFSQPNDLKGKEVKTQPTATL